MINVESFSLAKINFAINAVILIEKAQAKIHPL